MNRKPGLSIDLGLLDLSHDLFVELSTSGFVVVANRTFYETLGYQPDDFEGSSFAEIVTPSSREELETGLETTRGDVSVQGLILVLNSRDGREHPVTASFHPRSDGDEPTILAFFRSVTEQEAVREALHESEKRLSTVLENLPDVMFIFDSQGRYRQIYTANDNLLIRPRDEMLGSSIYDVMSDEEADPGMEIIEQVLHTQQPASLEYELQIDGVSKWFSAQVVPFAADSDPRVMWVSRDITDIVNARNQMEDNQQLLLSLLELEMQAREVVAYEIHDGFVQHAIGTQMWLQAAQEHLDGANPQVISAIKVAADSIAQGVEDARAMIRDLRPVVVEGQGVLGGLSQLVRVMQKKTDMPIRFLCDQPPPPILGLLEAQIFRIVQESLNNVIRHSQATEATVWLHGDEKDVYVEVTDNGIGFDTSKVPEGRYGLEGIERRANVFGGRSKLDSELGLGTRIRISFPVIDQEDPEADPVPRDSV